VGHVKLRCRSAERMAIRGRGVELHVTQRPIPCTPDLFKHWVVSCVPVLIQFLSAVGGEHGADELFSRKMISSSMGVSPRQPEGLGWVCGVCWRVCVLEGVCVCREGGGGHDDSRTEI